MTGQDVHEKLRATRPHLTGRMIFMTERSSRATPGASSTRSRIRVSPSLSPLPISPRPSPAYPRPRRSVDVRMRAPSADEAAYFKAGAEPAVAKAPSQRHRRRRFGLLLRSLWREPDRRQKLVYEGSLPPRAGRSSLDAIGEGVAVDVRANETRGLLLERIAAKKGGGWAGRPPGASPRTQEPELDAAVHDASTPHEREREEPHQPVEPQVVRRHLRRAPLRVARLTLEFVAFQAARRTAPLRSSLRE